MKAFYLVFLFVILSNNNVAQLAGVKWSESITKDKDKLSKVFSFEDSTVVVFNPELSKIRFDIFIDSRFQSTNNVEYKGKFLAVFRIGESIVIFSTFYNRSTKKDELYAKIVNKTASVEQLVLEEYTLGTLHSKFIINVSPDYNRIVVLTEKPYKKGIKESIILNVLTKDLMIERTTDYLMREIESQKRKINVPIIGNGGNVYIVKRYKEAKKQSQFYVLSYSSSIAFNELSLSSKAIKDIQYLLDDKGNLVLGGTYTSPNSVRIEGTYITKFDAGGSEVFKKKYDFRKETMLTFTSEKALKKEGVGLFDFKTSSLMEQRDNFSLVLEHKHNAFNSKTKINSDERKGLLVYAFDLKGNYMWDQSLKLNQKDESESGYWNSYICFNDTLNNNLTFVYNEVGYLDKKADNEFGEHTAVGARSIILNNQGEFTKKPIKNCFKGASIDLVLSPSFSKQNGMKVPLIAESLGKRFYVFGLLGK